MYINKNNQTIPDAILAAESLFSECSVRTSLGEVTVSYDSRLWTQQPISQGAETTLILCGWFIYKGQVNPLKQLREEIKAQGLHATLQHIEAGIFMGLYEDARGAVVFNDWFGLSAHFFRLENDRLLLSPFARSVSQQGELDAINAGYLETAAHLWGQKTIFAGVRRLLPSSLLRVHNVAGAFQAATEQYSDFTKVDSLPINELPSYMESTTSQFPTEHKFISLSAGFDSRMLGLTTQPSLAYTWGPERSKDVLNGGLIAKELGISWSTFGFDEHEIEALDKQLDQYLTEGQIKDHNPQFLRNYRFIAEQLKQTAASQFIVVDGYLGDGLQRGTYCYGGSLRAEIKKLLPSFFVGDSAERILSDSYRKLAPEALRELRKDLLSFDFRGLNVANNCQQVTAFESMNVRNFAYVYSGGIATNSVWNVVIAPFAFPRVYKSLVEQPAKDVLTYKVFKEFWSNIHSPLKKLRSEGQYSVATPALMIPLLNFFGRLLTHFVPRFHNYGTTKAKTSKK